MNKELLISLEHIACRFKYRLGRFRFGHYDALKDTSLDICSGETIGILGRNGAGKSTLLQIIAGVLRPDSGLVIKHKPVSISLLTLQLGFSPDLSGRDNALLGSMLLGRSRKQALDCLMAIREFSGLGDWFEKPVKSYSTGMRIRLSFSVALEINPDVLLVDEVLGVGDETFRHKSMDAMHNKMKSNQTVLFVSHNLHSLKELCTQSLWLENGATKMFGPTQQVVSAYLNFIEKSEDYNNKPHNHHELH